MWLLLTLTALALLVSTVGISFWGVITGKVSGLVAVGLCYVVVPGTLVGMFSGIVGKWPSNAMLFPASVIGFVVLIYLTFFKGSNLKEPTPPVTLSDDDFADLAQKI